MSLPDPVFAEYQRLWIVAENAVSQVYSRAELEAAITEYQFQQKQGDSPRFLGEQADESLHDLTTFVPSANQDS
jgi:hypothetical protein